jgi:O-acetyl-ADP-ribose deacetylase (regulator of RNase III)
MKSKLNGITLELLVGNLLGQAVDAIVVTATPDLDLDTDIGQQLVRLGGPSIEAECRAIGFADMGQAVLTRAGELPCAFIIHAVGPIMGTGNERGKLSSAIWNALHLAEERQIKTLAFSPISVGQFGYPIEGCAAVMAQKIVDFTFEELDAVRSIQVIVPDLTLYSLFDDSWSKEIQAALDETSA